MSAAKHTPGPWKAVRNEVHVGKRRICAYVTSGASLGIGSDLERSYANARLIAAAPELLEAVMRMVGSLGVMIPDPSSDGDIQFARAAIAKATGSAS